MFRRGSAMASSMSRRDFIGVVAMSSASPVPGRLEWADALQHRGPAATSPKLKLGVASYSLREFPLDRALSMAKTLGVTQMTFNPVHLPRTDPPETTRALRTRI